MPLSIGQSPDGCLGQGSSSLKRRHQRMETAAKVQSSDGPARFLPPLVITLTLFIFAAALLLVGQNLRHTIRTQIAARDGEILNAVTLTQQLATTPADEAEGPGREEPGDQIALLLKTSQLEAVVGALKGVIGARLYDRQGNLVTTFPAQITEADLPDADLDRLRALRPVSHFQANARLGDVLLRSPTRLNKAERTVPLLEVTIPLVRRAGDRDQLSGAAQFILDGRNIAAEFATLDRHLFLEASVIFLCGSLIIFVGLAWAFRRLQRSNRLLAERTTSLIRANHELALAAKTSAVGAVASHLIHGLKNPLFGLQNFMSGRGGESAADTAADWQAAGELTRRMQDLIAEIVRVLREENGAAGYEISLAELAELVTGKFTPSAKAAGVALAVHLAAEGTLTNRNANLVLLILENLIQNAVQATPPGKSVQVNLRPGPAGVLCEVRDEGPGVPARALGDLFTPCASSKAGGTGIGLAISKQLANHLGAALDLTSNSVQGCLFTLAIPAALLADAAALVHDAATAWGLDNPGK
jgi:signal transduction histidine kinase